MAWRPDLCTDHDLAAEDKIVDGEALEEDRRADLCGNQNFTARSC